LLSFDAWQCLLLNLTLGKAPIAEVILRAKGDYQLCQAYYYDGTRLVSLGQVLAGHSSMRKCLSFNTDCMERQLAERELGPNRAT